MPEVFDPNDFRWREVFNYPLSSGTPLGFTHIADTDWNVTGSGQWIEEGGHTPESNPRIYRIAKYGTFSRSYTLRWDVPDASRDCQIAVLLRSGGAWTYSGRVNLLLGGGTPITIRLTHAFDPALSVSASEVGGTRSLPGNGHFDTSTYYWIRAWVLNRRLRVRAWPVTQDEPCDTWYFDETRSAPFEAGSPGIGMAKGLGNNAHALFDQINYATGEIAAFPVGPCFRDPTDTIPPLRLAARDDAVKYGSPRIKSGKATSKQGNEQRIATHKTYI